MITFDGYSGAGKTTQGYKIAELLGVQSCTLSPMQTITDHYYKAAVGAKPSGFSRILRDVGIIRAMQQGTRCWGQGGGHFVIANGFFCNLLPFRNSDRLDLILDLFRKALYLEGGKEPDASFFLNVSYAECASRVIYRNIDGVEEVKIAGKGSEGDESIKFWEYLASQLPYLHIINGAQEKEAVTRDIVGILRQEGIIKGE